MFYFHKGFTENIEFFKVSHYWLFYREWRDDVKKILHP